MARSKPYQRRHKTPTIVIVASALMALTAYLIVYSAIAITFIVAAVWAVKHFT